MNKLNKAQDRKRKASQNKAKAGGKSGINVQG